MKNKYKKIIKEQVLETLINFNLDIINYNPIVSIPNIANLLETSEYQVRKYMRELKKDGLVEIDFFSMNSLDEYENYPPMKGFCITEKKENY